MLCEGRLHIVTFGKIDELDFFPSQKAVLGPSPQESPVTAASKRPSSLTRQWSSSEELYMSLSSHGNHQLSPGIDIQQHHVPSGGDAHFLVPSFCESICKNYSDLHIGGDQVLPVWAHKAELQVCADPQATNPFLQSSDVLPAGESLQAPPSQGEGLLFRPRVGSSRWWLGTGCDRSFQFQGCERPFSNSLLNHYLETKVFDLYQQYMMENMAREGSAAWNSASNAITPLLCSDLVLTSLDQITLQLSREANLEASLAKDMVLSCLLRVAGDGHSCEISTPLLQISNETTIEQIMNKIK